MHTTIKQNTQQDDALKRLIVAAWTRWRKGARVLRATQASLSAAKGAGFVAGHPAGRWCQEALFFMVWSCPQHVMNAQLCQLAGIQAEQVGEV